MKNVATETGNTAEDLDRMKASIEGLVAAPTKAQQTMNEENNNHFTTIAGTAKPEITVNVAPTPVRLEVDGVKFAQNTIGEAAYIDAA